MTLIWQETKQRHLPAFDHGHRGRGPRGPKRSARITHALVIVVAFLLWGGIGRVAIATQ